MSKKFYYVKTAPISGVIIDTINNINSKLDEIEEYKKMVKKLFVKRIQPFYVEGEGISEEVSRRMNMSLKAKLNTLADILDTYLLRNGLSERKLVILEINVDSIVIGLDE